MLSDPLSITIGSDPGTVSLPRVSSGDGRSKYQNSDGTVELLASSSYGKRTRRVIRVNMKKVSSDPFIPANNIPLSASVYVVFDAPATGFTPQELLDMESGLVDLMSASSDSVTLKLLGGES